MQFENPQIPDDINHPQGSPLKTFAKLLAMATILALLVIITLNMLAQFAATLIPFRFEAAIAEQFASPVQVESGQTPVTEFYLQGLADKIIAQSGAPEDIVIKVHYANENLVNAYATLGGHVFFFKGLVEKLESEQALAMVMAHEIAHVVNRDPISAIGRGLTTALALSAIFGSTDNALIRRYVAGGELLTSLKYSRDDELSADADAFDWVNRLYGHGCGVEQLFELFDAMSADTTATLPEIFTTHPYAARRLERIHTKQSGACADAGAKITPNPLYVKR